MWPIEFNFKISKHGFKKKKKTTIEALETILGVGVINMSW